MPSYSDIATPCSDLAASFPAVLRSAVIQGQHYGLLQGQGVQSSQPPVKSPITSLVRFEPPLPFPFNAIQGEGTARGSPGFLHLGWLICDEHEAVGQTLNLAFHG